MTEINPGDALANTLDDAKRRERILAEVGAVEIDPNYAGYPSPLSDVAYGHVSSASTQAECGELGEAREDLILAAAYALAAIEAIDKENGR